MTQPMTYGPSALRTPANLITVVRMLAAPVMIALVLHDRYSYTPAVAWLFLSVTDGADGYVARRHGTTKSGAFLDPLADKILVFGVFAALVYLGKVALIPVVIMGVREIVISIYRSVVLRKGISVPARMLGKLKMVVQLLVIELAILPISGLERAVTVLLWVATFLAVASGVQYLMDARAKRVHP